MVGSIKKPGRDLSGALPLARKFFVHLSCAPWRWTEGALLFHVANLAQDTDQYAHIALQADIEGSGYCSRSGALQSASCRLGMHRFVAREEPARKKTLLNL